MLDQRRRRWADVVQMLYKCFVFTGMVGLMQCKKMNGTLHTYSLNWAFTTSPGWYNESDDTAVQTQDSNTGGLRLSTLSVGHRYSPQYLTVLCETL